MSSAQRAVHNIMGYTRIGREMRLTAQVGEFEMDEVILDLGSEVNVLTKKTWEQMGSPNSVRSPIHLRLANQQRVSPLGRLPQVPVDIDGVCSFVDFEVIEIIGDSRPYPALLGIDWEIDKMAVIDLKKRQMTFRIHRSKSSHRWILFRVLDILNLSKQRMRCVTWRTSTR